ncbi:hypothetical protein THRCLA_21472 [Thraustotheca clavata]|uniref:C-CAP/cofactor C-like domain-containing protein n=1 Tax=Thraustotheca clavata TaxID=74557 RepID=A0A1V9ZW50_9STRA|nr:hypothetical protein THRCLA_21472 [Thraustotheca clavata]
MGNTKTKPTKKLQRSSKSFDGSFGRKMDINPADYICRAQENTVVVRKPGSIAGQQFIIEECKQCSIFLLDHTTSVQIDQCSDCTIFVGPCTSSLFVRDCTRVTLVCIAQQFRTRDCKDMDIWLFSTTAPIIETSSQLRIGCCRSSYFALHDQLDKAKFSIWNNKWSEIFDFTPERNNWKPVAFTTDLWPSAVQQHLPSELLQEVGYAEDAMQSILPITHGPHARFSDGMVGLLCVSTGNSMVALDIAHLALTKPEIKLIQTRQFHITTKQANILFEKGASIHKKNSSLHDLIVMEWSGTLVEETLQTILQEERVKPHLSNIYLNVQRGREKCDLCWIEWKESI